VKRWRFFGKEGRAIRESEFWAVIIGKSMWSHNHRYVKKSRYWTDDRSGIKTYPEENLPFSGIHE